ncbi:hypothetical protein [Crocinitomix algicola]|uniref:hypothetical protein n=1 Tax=Crocinitomix algicola TaxID=1740263 RepID=UPI001112F692|nr:hypothetical protein [Crocinitomix algicola]
MAKIQVKLLVVFLCVFCVPIVHSQSESFNPKGSFSVDLGVPTKAKNPAFEKVMEGLLNMGLDYRHNVYKGLTVGGGLKYSFFTLNSFAFNSNQVTGSYHMPGGYAMVGYEKFTTDRVSFNGNLRVGYSSLLSVNDTSKALYDGPYIKEAFFIEPTTEIVMLTDKVSPHGFSFVLSYSFYFNEFTKDDVSMKDISSIPEEDYNGITRFLSIGFGYRYYLGRN